MAIGRAVLKNLKHVENRISAFSASCSQPDVVIISADATNDRGTAERNFRQCSHRHTQSASHRAVIYTRLSSSAAEVQIPHSDDDDNDEKYSFSGFHGSELLESTHSLTYLEWVHERQTRRMRTRSEWFLLPAPSAKVSDTSRLNASEFSSASLQPGSQFDDSTMGSSDGRTGSTDNTDECPISVTRELKPLKGYKGKISSSSVTTAEQFPVVRQSATRMSRIAGGIVRRRSWRTHYVRPNRTAESCNRERNSDEVAVVSSRSAPLYRRNIPHACSRGLQSSGRTIMLPSSMELQQRQRPAASPSEHQKLYYRSSGGDSSSNPHVGDSKTTQYSKNMLL
uniref:DUF4005 domain-containing protein n=1 Tax=Setaria digitata TaxID=48799 RepID=A0A915Q2B2_9BILA